MNESACCEILDAPANRSSDADALVNALRSEGADRFDPVGFHYLEVLCRRTSAHHGNVKHILEKKLIDAVDAHRKRFSQTRTELKEAIAALAPQSPHAISDLRRLLDTGEFRKLRHQITTLNSVAPQANFADLVHRLAQHAPHHIDEQTGEYLGASSELKSVLYFRNTWAKLSADKLVKQALNQAPRNAGPINSHMVALRSLALMRDTSPDYLNRFLSYVDTLLCLDHSAKSTLPSTKITSNSGSDGKTSTLTRK